MFNCTFCDKSYNTAQGLNVHYRKTHELTGKELIYNLIHGISEIPTCRCGCGEQTSLSTNGYREFVHGHYVRTTNGFYSETGIARAAETRRKQFASGERTQWNKGIKLQGEKLEKAQQVAKAPERCRKISEALTGKPKSEEHRQKIATNRKEYWSKPENQEAQRERRMQFIINTGLGYSSKLEKLFKHMLDELNIEYIEQFYVKEIKALYDFKIKHLPILIEVDGDYWHCNPNIERFKTPTQQWHHDNIKRDLIKTNWASNNKFILLRLWESDLINHPGKCIQRLKEAIEQCH